MENFFPTILIVDDDESDKIFITQAFENLGVKDGVRAVNGGNEAIAYMLGEGKYADRKKFAYPTFIMTDLKMPDGDGFDVLFHLNSRPEWSIIPTIVFSGSTDPDDIKTAYFLGASSYHVKPQNIELLNEQIRVIHDYWKTCQVPVVDITGKQVPTFSRGKLGDRFRNK